MNYRKLTNYTPKPGHEYSVTVRPGQGNTYTVYPVCPRCFTNYHECDAVGPADRVFVPANN